MNGSRTVEAVAWALCPHLRFHLSGEWPECARCPASSYYPEVEMSGTRFCRHMAEKAARAALVALEAAEAPKPG